MTNFEVLSEVEASEFPEEWYDHSDESHFWVRWRISAFFHQLSSLDIHMPAESRGLDIGCAHGVVQNQIEGKTACIVDGCDLNRVALEMGHKGRGCNYLYNIHDRRGDMRERYDFLVLFDVIEHIEETTPFLESALYHLKPGGLVFVNVPAIQGLYSRYDEVAGHVRRYDKPTLLRELEACGTAVLDMRYWGLSLIPLLMLRKTLLALVHRDGEDVIRFGFKPPSALVSKILMVMMKCETTLLHRAPVGSSLLAVSKKA